MTKAKVANNRAKPQRDGLVGIRDFRDNLPKYVRKLNKGESFTVLRHSTPIFRAVPPEEDGLSTVIDLKEIAPEGVSAKDIYDALQALKN